MENRIAPIIFIFGIICIIAGIAMGEGKAGIFIIFPFIYGEGLLMFIGIILIFISFAVFIFSQFHLPENVTTEKHAGGLILIGPIPIIISSSWKMALFLLAIAIIIILLFAFYAIY